MYGLEGWWGSWGRAIGSICGFITRTPNCNKQASDNNSLVSAITALDPPDHENEPDPLHFFGQHDYRLPRAMRGSKMIGCVVFVVTVW